MKTAISVPDETFRRVEEFARETGRSRSEIFARAVALYLDHEDRDSLTRRIDSAVDLLGDDESARVAVEAGRARLAETDDEW